MLKHATLETYFLGWGWAEYKTWRPCENGQLSVSEWYIMNCWSCTCEIICPGGS